MTDTTNITTNLRLVRFSNGSSTWVRARHILDRAV